MHYGGACTWTHRVILLYIFQAAVRDILALVPTGHYAGCMSLTLNYLFSLIMEYIYMQS